MTTDSPAPSAGELVTRKDLDITEQITSAGFVPKTMADFKALCNWIWKSKFAPKGFDSPEQIFIACQTAMEAGVPIMAGLRTLYVVHGTPSWNGQGALALIRSKGRCKLMPRLRWEGDDDNHRAIWRFQREDDHEPIESEYSVADAKRAGLWKKQGPWQTNPDDMLAWRAVSRMGKYYFSDTLLGLDIAESVRDYPREALDRSPHAGAGRPAELAAGTKDPLLPDEPHQDVVTDSMRGGPRNTLTATEASAGLKVVDGELVPAKSDPLIPDEAKPGIAGACPHCSTKTEIVSHFLDEGCPTLEKQGAKDAAELIRKTDGMVALPSTGTIELQLGAAPQEPATSKGQQELLPAAESKDPPAVFIGKGEPVSARQATTLRGMARNRCTELKLDGPDCWSTLLHDALGCMDQEVSVDRYEDAKARIKTYEMPK